MPSLKVTPLVNASSIAASLLFGLVAAIPFVLRGDRAVSDYAFSVTMTTTRPGHVQLFFDEGSGLSEVNSVQLALPPVGETSELRFQLPPSRLVGLRLDPIRGDGELTIANPRVVKGADVSRQFELTDLVPVWDIASATVEPGLLRITPKSGAVDPQLQVTLAAPLDLRPARASTSFRYGTFVLIAAGGVIAFLALVQWIPAVRRQCTRAREWSSAHPQSSIALVAALAALLSNYPVIFLGRSYLSPNLVGPLLLYEAPPTLPGLTEARLEDPMGSDVGAIPWHHHPLSIIEGRALFADGELPLWNRYDSAGVPLLGQGQSMFGDPLHFLPILANGAAWAWDIKYIVARWLFCTALGLIVWRLTRHEIAARVTAFSAAFIGFFLFRVNHPAQFSMCYAPSILVAWIGLMQATNRRATVGWFAGLIGACWAEINSGTAKEAYMLLIGMNVTGGLLVVFSVADWLTKLRQLAWAAMAGVVFICLSAPVWMTFLDALEKAYTSYHNPQAFQILPTLILGLFDELFYRPIHAQEYVWNPSANFLVFGGVMFLLATWRRSGPDRARLALAISATLSFLLAFGIVPPEWVIRIPFVANIAHVDNTFSCVLIVHLIVLAGLGIRMAAERLRSPEARGDICAAMALGSVPVLLWLALTHTVHREPFGSNTVRKILHWGEHLPVTNFIWFSLVALVVALLGITLIWWRVQRRGSWTAAEAILALTCLGTLLWRHGQHYRTNFDKYLYNPAIRTDLLAPSPAIQFVQAQTDAPVRTVGLGLNLFPGWSGAYGIESTSGPDAVSSPYYRDLTSSGGLVRMWDWVVLPAVENLARERKFYDFLNVKFYVNLHSRVDEITKTLQREFAGDLIVYSSPSAWPRGFFTDRVARYDTAQDLGKMILEGDGQPFAAMQRADPAAPADLDGPLDNRAVIPGIDWKITNNTTSFTIRATGPGMVALHENWFDGDFRVTIDGRPAPCLRVNHAFKGVTVPAAGEYRITFAYWPERFSLSLGLAAFGAVVLGGVSWWGWRRSPL